MATRTISRASSPLVPAPSPPSPEPGDSCRYDLTPPVPLLVLSLVPSSSVSHLLPLSSPSADVGLSSLTLWGTCSRRCLSTLSLASLLLALLMTRLLWSSASTSRPARPWYRRRNLTTRTNGLQHRGGLSFSRWRRTYFPNLTKTGRRRREPASIRAARIVRVLPGSTVVGS